MLVDLCESGPNRIIKIPFCQHTCYERKTQVLIITLMMSLLIQVSLFILLTHQKDLSLSLCHKQMFLSR